MFVPIDNKAKSFYGAREKGYPHSFYKSQRCAGKSRLGLTGTYSLVRFITSNKTVYRDRVHTTYERDNE